MPLAGVPCALGPQVVLTPAFRPTIGAALSRLQGTLRVSARSSLLLDGEIHILNLELTPTPTLTLTLTPTLTTPSITSCGIWCRPALRLPPPTHTLHTRVDYHLLGNQLADPDPDHIPNQVDYHLLGNQFEAYDEDWCAYNPQGFSYGPNPNHNHNPDPNQVRVQPAGLLLWPWRQAHALRLEEFAGTHTQPPPSPNPNPNPNPSPNPNQLASAP